MSDTMYCGACGAAQSAQARFCSACGAGLGALQPAPPASVSPVDAAPIAVSSPEPRPSKPRGLLIGIGAGALALAAVGAFAVSQSGGDKAALADTVTPVAATATVTAAPSATVRPTASAPAPVPTVTRVVEAAPQRTVVVERGSSDGWTRYKSASGVSGRFSRFSTLNSSTTLDFARNVADAYARSGARGGSTSVEAWSPATGKWYDMWCASSGESVVCTGGKNARVLLSD